MTKTKPQATDPKNSAAINTLPESDLKHVTGGQDMEPIPWRRTWYAR